MKPQAAPASDAGERARAGSRSTAGCVAERRRRRTAAPSAPMQELALGADVEEAGLEAEADGEPAEDRAASPATSGVDDRRRSARRDRQPCEQRARRPSSGRRPVDRPAGDQSSTARMMIDADDEREEDRRRPARATTAPDPSRRAAPRRQRGGRRGGRRLRSRVPPSGRRLVPRSAARRAAGRHQQADLLACRPSRPSTTRDDLAAVHDRDPVGQLEDLVELGRDEQDRRPGVALRDRLAVDELDAADVEAAGRLVEDEQLAGRG